MPVDLEPDEISMASEGAKIAFLEKHVGYDLAMLNYTFIRVATLRPANDQEQLDFNAFLESFAVHARNLVRFLSKKSRVDAHNATDYVEDFEVPNQTRLQHPLFRLQQLIAGTAPRTSDPQQILMPMMHASFMRGSCRRYSSLRRGSARNTAPASILLGVNIRQRRQQENGNDLMVGRSQNDPPGSVRASP